MYGSSLMKFQLEDFLLKHRKHNEKKFKMINWKITYANVKI